MTDTSSQKKNTTPTTPSSVPSVLVAAQPLQARWRWIQETWSTKHKVETQVPTWERWHTPPPSKKKKQRNGFSKYQVVSWKVNNHDSVWLVVSTHLKNISQNGNLPQLGMKIKNIWNHHLVIHEMCFPLHPLNVGCVPSSFPGPQDFSDPKLNNWKDPRGRSCGEWTPDVCLQGRKLRWGYQNTIVLL